MRHYHERTAICLGVSVCYCNIYGRWIVYPKVLRREILNWLQLVANHCKRTGSAVSFLFDYLGAVLLLFWVLTSKPQYYTFKQQTTAAKAVKG